MQFVLHGLRQSRNQLIFSWSQNDYNLLLYYFRGGKGEKRLQLVVPKTKHVFKNFGVGIAWFPPSVAVSRGMKSAIDVG